MNGSAQNCVLVTFDFGFDSSVVMHLLPTFGFLYTTWLYCWTYFDFFVVRLNVLKWWTPSVWIAIVCICKTAPQRSPTTFPGAFSVSKGTPHVITLYWQVGCWNLQRCTQHVLSLMLFCHSWLCILRCLKYLHCFCLGWSADLQMAQLIPLPLTVSCCRKSRLVLFFPFWYRLTRVVPDKIQRAIKVCSSCCCSSCHNLFKIFG